tara:strand:+ start:426 stop:944 length:519 start_codon:yes stop_codon:yes gene_type:complete
MCKDQYILRLSNVTHSANGDLVSLSADKSEYTVKIPEKLRSKGKCKVSVLNITIQVKNGTGTSIVPTNAHTALIQSEGIEFLGYNNETGGNVNVLAEMSVGTANTIRLDSPNGLSFTCPGLPPTITIKKMVYNPIATPAAVAFLPIAMDGYTAAVVPCIVTLGLEFDEDKSN